MRGWYLAFAVGILAGPGATPAPGQGPARGPEYWDSVTAAARELRGALDSFQQVFLTDSGPIQGRGLFAQSEQIIGALIYFRQQVGRKVSRDDLYLAFDKVDRQVKGMLGEIKDLEKWDSGLRLAARRVQTANHDLQFALAAGDNSPAQVSQVVYRQTLALLARTETLDRTAKWVFFERPPLQGWTADVADLRRGVVAFQKLQEKKAPVDELRKQLEQVGKVCDRLVGRYKDSAQDQFLLQSAVAGVDRGFARLAGLFGIKGHRAPLKDNRYE
ncbi:MAG: hypothetical protein L0Z62_09095 [Gemmataceae bacterium]|nr:hypothetical protein [Gemmataceae bacterium]